eukprot:TRINITY_DN35116_c0_g1_i3.p2 TRINITY_DN35116_c0_g1~~TRINITY_DN35116_c0_g1_i3.p2  ORF type:complete len:215 (-),score=37.72 TRINITY_DN35116_c0_g1_i3:205-849(-)
MFSIFAFILCTCTFATFGTTTRHVVVNNIGTDGKGQKFDTFPEICKITLWVLLAFRSLLALPVFLYPLADFFDDAIPSILGSSKADADEGQSSIEIGGALYAQQDNKFKWERWVSLSAAVVACSLFTVALWNVVVQLEMLTGSIFKSLNTCIFPCAGYLKLDGKWAEEEPMYKQVLAYIVLAIGMIWGVAGTILAIRELPVVQMILASDFADFS